MALTNASLPAKRRILAVCVKLFLEQGYKKTTVAEIVQKADVSNSSFQNIFRAKDGVLTELVAFMFETQFDMARRTTGGQLSPLFVYAVETCIQLTLTELNENLREIYIEAYTHEEAAEYIHRQTAKELRRIFGSYQPELTPEDFYACELGSAGLMRGYMRPVFPAGKEAGRLPDHESPGLQGPGGGDRAGACLHQRHGYPRHLPAGDGDAVSGAGHAVRFRAG